MKTVLFPIEVPDGEYCWEFHGRHELCPYFDNEGGHSRCVLGFHDLSEENEGIRKSPRCESLKEVVSWWHQ